MEDGEPAVGLGRPAAPGGGHLAQLGACAAPISTAWVAMADSVMRSAQRSPHHLRSSGVEKHQVDAPDRTSVKPAAWAHARRKRPAFGLAALARATVSYIASHASSAGSAGYQVNAS